jgi:hypothetical protein
VLIGDRDVVDDLRLLPDSVRDSARRYGNGEVGWPLGQAEAAVNALAGAGFVLLGLDLREHDAEGRFVGVPWSTFNGDEVASGRLDRELARQAAVFAVARAMEEHGLTSTVWILATWTRG